MSPEILSQHVRTSCSFWGEITFTGTKHAIIPTVGMTSAAVFSASEIVLKEVTQLLGYASGAGAIYLLYFLIKELSLLCRSEGANTQESSAGQNDNSESDLSELFHWLMHNGAMAGSMINSMNTVMHTSMGTMEMSADISSILLDGAAGGGIGLAVALGLSVLIWALSCALSDLNCVKKGKEYFNRWKAENEILYQRAKKIWKLGFQIGAVLGSMFGFGLGGPLGAAIGYIAGGILGGLVFIFIAYITYSVYSCVKSKNSKSSTPAESDSEPARYARAKAQFFSFFRQTGTMGAGMTGGEKLMEIAPSLLL